MNPIAQWILLGLGIVFIIVGAGIMIWGLVQKRTVAGADADGGIAPALKAIADLFDAFGRYFGPNASVRVGWIFIAVGLVLIFGPFFIPART